MMKGKEVNFTDAVERSDVVEDENFFHSIRNFRAEVFDKLADINIVLGKHVEDRQSGNFT